MSSYWDLLPAGAWPTQPFVPRYDPMQARWAVDTTQASPSPTDWSSARGSALSVPPNPAGYDFAPLASPGTRAFGAPSHPDFSAPFAPNPDPGVGDPARYQRMADDAKRTYDAAMWAFGPPSVPQSPSMRQAPAPLYRAAQPAAAADAPGPPASGVDDATSAPWPVPAANASPWPVDARDQSTAPAGSSDAPLAPALAAAVGNQHIARQGDRIRAAAATRPLPPALVRTIFDDAGHAVTDIPHEIYQAGADALHNMNAGLNPFSAERRADLVNSAKAATPGDALAAYLESQKRLGRSLLGIPQFLGAPITGASRSLLGRPLHALDTTMRDLAVRIHGEGKVRQAEEARGDRPGGQTYEDAKATADSLMMGLGPRGGGLRAPPAPLTRALPPPIEPIIGEGGGVPRVDARGVPPPPIHPPSAASDLVRPPSLPLPALPAPQEMLALPPPRPQLALPAPPAFPPFAFDGPRPVAPWLDPALRPRPPGPAFERAPPQLTGPAGGGREALPIDARSLQPPPFIPPLPLSELLRPPQLRLPPLTDPRDNPAIPIPPSRAVSTLRHTAPGERFFHYGYARDEPKFAGGLKAPSFATDDGSLAGLEAQDWLALPNPEPPDAVYPVNPEPGTWVHVNPVTAPTPGRTGGRPEFKLIFGTGPGTVGTPSLIPSKR
jgi:hypothetical protein